MELDPLILARVQFAANISFHILFPAITIGLAWVLFYFRVRFTLSGDKSWEYAYYFWVKIFALSFALGVVSGLTMSFQFGTNWPGFMERAGNVAGPLLGYEVLTAFFLEASFLGIMLFGKRLVSNRVHLIATFLVALGTWLSAFWILALNSWMQTPQGYVIEDGVFLVESWSAVIFNPSFPYRFLHMTIASFLTCAFLIAGVSAWRITGKLAGPGTWKVMRTGVLMAAVLAPLQIFVGDLHGLNTLKHQPAKVAAMEAIWDSGEGQAFTLFGFPDEVERRNRYAIEFPFLASLILTHEIAGAVQGLNDFIDEHAPVAIVFWSFRVMLLMGTLMLVVSWWGAWNYLRKREPSSLFLKVLSWMTFSGWIAVLAGWYVTEIGRQPWIIYGLVRVDEIVADHSAATMSGTLTGYILLYIFLLGSYMGALRYLSRSRAASLVLVDQSEGPREPHAAPGSPASYTEEERY
jgi:cytochrome bd ubiquinol oxidase subunit I